jgi:hypothetical protein
MSDYSGLSIASTGIFEAEAGGRGMTLIVFAYKRNPMTQAVEGIEEKPAYPRNDMAGFEIWRKDVWGSDVIRDLGLTLIPTLAQYDIYADGPEVDQLEAELGTMVHRIKEIADKLGIEEDTLLFRIDNMREAVRLARRVKDGLGGVYIG